MTRFAAELEFERLPRSHATGTSKLYSRGDFLPYGDPLAFDQGDFIGRLRALFGPAEDDEYVLRHRATGYVITAYSAQSGPSYGGGPRYPEALPEVDESVLVAGMYDRNDASERIAADPELAAGPPSARPENSGLLDDIEGQRRLVELDHPWHRRFADASAPPGFAEVAARLDQLLNSVTPVDWEDLRYYSDAPTVYRVGVRDGESFCWDLSVSESLDILLRMAEAGDVSLRDTAGRVLDEPNMRVVEYWVLTKAMLDAEDEDYELDYEDEDEDDDEEDEDDDENDDEDDDENDDEDDEDDEARAAALERALPRVQAAWFRAVETMLAEDEDEDDEGDDDELRAHLIENAREHAAMLGIDPTEAEAALAAASRR